MPRANRNIKDGNRRCTGCDNWFPADLDHFYHSVGGALGTCSKCKTCIDAQTYARREKYPDEIVQYNKDYYQKTRDVRIAKSSDWFYAHREHALERRRQWGKRPEYKFRVRVYHSKRKAHELAAKGSHTQQDIQDIYKRQKGKCYYCKKKVGDKFEVDHVVPISRDGGNDPSNLVVACRHCNRSKHDKMPHEWPQGGRLL